MTQEKRAERLKARQADNDDEFVRGSCCNSKRMCMFGGDVSQAGARVGSSLASLQSRLSVAVVFSRDGARHQVLTY